MNDTKTIYIFGDSYGEWYEDGSSWHWPKQLQDKYKDVTKIQSYAVSGSGLNYSLHEFQKIIQKKIIKPNDVIIFLLTGCERIYSQSMPHPRLGMVTALDEYIKFKPEWAPWIKKNKDAIIWSVTNVFDVEINYETIKVASLLKVWADLHPENTVILFNNFPNFNVELLPKIPTTYNFFNFSQVPLHNISYLECGFDEDSAMLEDRYITQSNDKRMNHMTYANCNIMAEMIFQVIESKDPEKWDWSRFQKHILRHFDPRKK